MFRKRNLWFLTIASCVMMVSGGAFATDPTPPSGTYNIVGTENYAAGRPIVASKAYVDSRTDLAYHTLDENKQNKLAAKSGDAKILLEPNTAGAEPNKKTVSTTIITTGANASSDDNNIPTVGAVEALVTAQAATDANTYQPKAGTTGYQVGTNGDWKQLADGTYVKPTATGNNVKLDIDSNTLTSSTSDVVTGTSKLVTSGVLADYHDASKQNKLPYNSTAKVIIAPTTDGGNATTRDITGLGSEIDSTDNGLTTGQAVYEYINSKGYEANVQADWTEADSSSDAYIAHKPNGTSGNIMTYTGTEGVYSSMGVDTGIDSASTDSDVATAKAVYSYHDATKVNVAQGTAYQVLTTGTDGNVTHEYLKVPVTGSGEPTSNNQPSTTASMWLE